MTGFEFLNFYFERKQALRFDNLSTTFKTKLSRLLMCLDISYIYYQNSLIAESASEKKNKLLSKDLTMRRRVFT